MLNKQDLLYKGPLMDQSDMQCTNHYNFSVLGPACYPRRAWAATGIVVCQSVCLSVLFNLLTWLPQHCVYSMDSLHTTSYYF